MKQTKWIVIVSIIVLISVLVFSGVFKKEEWRWLVADKETMTWVVSTPFTSESECVAKKNIVVNLYYPQGAVCAKNCIPEPNQTFESGSFHCEVYSNK